MRFAHILAVLVLTLSTTFGQVKTNEFEGEIKAFEAADKVHSPPQHAILFIGSSSIRLWKTLAEDFPQYNVINRGFGGSAVSDSVFFMDRIVFPYHPRLVVMFAGSNDINSKKTPQTVFNDFKAFAERTHEELPETRLAYISISPCPSRWSQTEQVREANRLIQQYTRSAGWMSFIDVYPKMLGEDGKPLSDIYMPDNLHMNPKGYLIWKGIVGNHLANVLKEKTDK